VSRLRDDGPEYETVSVPVLVVGTGSAGARTAIELAERGVEPLDDGYELDYDHLE
jgi:succinate dehydrogenase / fumarate reductase flavoprotein subunit